jgi:hypothetical protein
LFVKGRYILIASGIVDDAKRKENEIILFKVDFEKAYDSTEWNLIYRLCNGHYEFFGEVEEVDYDGHYEIPVREFINPEYMMLTV